MDTLFSIARLAAACCVILAAAGVVCALCAIGCFLVAEFNAWRDRRRRPRMPRSVCALNRVSVRKRFGLNRRFRAVFSDDDRDDLTQRFRELTEPNETTREN